MKRRRHCPALVRVLILAASLGCASAASPAQAQSCQTAREMEAATRQALEGVARQYLRHTAAGDAAALRAAALPGLAQDFAAIEEAVFRHQEAFREARAQVRSSFLLENPASGPQPARFLCGIWNSPERVAFVLPGLAPGRYGLVILDVGGTPGHTLSVVVKQEEGSGAWRLAGYYVRPATLGGHDSGWFQEQARRFAERGQRHNAWFYYLMARELLAPVPFMGSVPLDRLYDESQKVLPAELPYERPLELEAAGRTRRITEMFPAEAGDEVALVVRYEAEDVADTRQTHAENLALIRALVARYPEYKDAFHRVVARAVEPGGRDFGSELAMKDVK